ncbi:uncharacterized oxidoreductase MT0954-like [Oppia nitens]|uniref:uncharacterized oxidoreductase MT0954-like n=1 Tax=Oppia nitens TaxID=1686743 RepID=UPI0023DB5EE0|nr:uncharacterized oxidoreductase MT0954-like [Oppia nitens]XP_054161196.1 uncharacterized oxidoreductase MT0954-like [Oppia nitens]
MAVEFAKCGARVVVTGRNQDRVTAVANQCRAVSTLLTTTTILPIVANICLEADCQLLVNKTIETYGQIDILINNADCPDSCDLLDPMFTEKLDQLLDIELRATVRLTQLSVPYLEKSIFGGNIVNISANICTHSMVSMHSTAKSALQMYSKCAAAGLASHGIRVNVVVVGVITTETMSDYGITNDGLANYAARLPVRRVGQIGDIWSAVSYLASSVKAGFVTGSTVRVVGGEHVAHVFVEQYL